MASPQGQEPISVCTDFGGNPGMGAPEAALTAGSGSRSQTRLRLPRQFAKCPCSQELIRQRREKV